MPKICLEIGLMNEIYDAAVIARNEAIPFFALVI